MTKKLLVRAIICALVTAPGLHAQNAPLVVRVAHFPNIKHSQPLMAKAQGWLEKALAPEAHVEWETFNAGPSFMEALFAGAIDMTYIGQNPTISGYVRSKGEALCVVAGATSGGASIVVRADQRLLRSSGTGRISQGQI